MYREAEVRHIVGLCLHEVDPLCMDRMRAYFHLESRFGKHTSALISSSATRLPYLGLTAFSAAVVARRIE